MNCEVFHLNELEIEHSEIREVLQCILHTVTFHRALGVVHPIDVNLELCGITYVQCGEVEVEMKIDEKIVQFLDWLVKNPIKKSQICLSFYEVKNKKTSWFSNRIERLYFEHWYINLNLKSHSEVADLEEAKNARRKVLEVSLRNVLFQIIDFTQEKMDHVPPIPDSEDAISFPYEITIPSSSDSAFGMDITKRMIQTGHPTMLS